MLSGLGSNSASYGFGIFAILLYDIQVPSAAPLWMLASAAKDKDLPDKKKGENKGGAQK